MDKPVIRGTYADLKNVKTRGVVQIIVEVPIANADHALKVLGGWPDAGKETWLAVARLDPKAAQEAPQDDEKRKWSELSRAEQAGIACNDPGFQAWTGTNGQNTDDALAAAVWVRVTCGVKSRAEFDTSKVAAELWDQLYGNYDAERRGMMG